MRTIRLQDDTVFYLHDAGELLSDAIVRDNDYFESEILYYLADKHPQQDVILDVGANIGNHTVYFAQYLEYSKIYCFEPVLDNYNILLKNVEKLPNIETRMVAVGDKEGQVFIDINRTNMGASEITKTENEYPIKQICLDGQDFEDVTFIKIDVEWYEPRVLMGAKHLIKKYKPIILIEDATGEGTRGILEHLGYEREVGWPEHKTYLYRSVSA